MSCNFLRSWYQASTYIQTAEVDSVIVELGCQKPNGIPLDTVRKASLSSSLSNRSFVSFLIFKPDQEVLIMRTSSSLLLLSLAGSGLVFHNNTRISAEEFSPTLSQQILAQHNALRASTHFPASDMTSLRWSPVLAREAEEWARQCDYRHFTRNGMYGQNIYRQWGLPQSLVINAALIKRMMMSFGENEKQVLVPEALQRPFDARGRFGPGLLDHYTQIVWSDTQLVGCAVVRNCPSSSSNIVKELMVVCNYFPAGNRRGWGWYEVGPRCSKCKAGWGCQEGLCIAP